MDLLQKLEILADAAKYDASCASSGTSKRDSLGEKAGVGSTEGNAFQAAMKQDHTLAMEYIARLLRHTVAHNGPVKRHEIDPWLRREAVDEFVALVAGG